MLSNLIILVKVRRELITGDSLLVVQNSKERLQKPYTRIQVMFLNEAGIDQGGLKKEWFSLMKNKIFLPAINLFKLSNNRRCLFPNSLAFLIPNSMVTFHFAGNFIGLVYC